MTNEPIYAKIRTWDDMLQEYGSKYSDQSVIEIPKGFTSQMEKMMPSNRIIQLIKAMPNSTNDYYKGVYYWQNNKDDDDRYIISEEMIEQHYGNQDPNDANTIIFPTKDTNISEPEYNALRQEYWIPIEGKGYLHSDMIIRTSTAPFETGYYPTEQSALFAKLRFERLQQKGLLRDFSKPTNHYYSITDSDITCSS